jgi:hypothetical protein
MSLLLCKDDDGKQYTNCKDYQKRCRVRLARKHVEHGRFLSGCSDKQHIFLGITVCQFLVFCTFAVAFTAVADDHVDVVW